MCGCAKNARKREYACACCIVLSQFLPAIQSRICVEATVCFGVWGFKVPAIALQPFSMISWANCLASTSALNLRVARTHLRSALSRLGVMFER